LVGHSSLLFSFKHLVHIIVTVTLLDVVICTVIAMQFRNPVRSREMAAAIFIFLRKLLAL
jgi:hypothetical protein